MKPPSRIAALIGFLLVVLGAKLGQGAYRWVAYADERALIAELREELVDAGAEIVRTAAEVDSLRVAIDHADDALEAGRRTLQRYSRLAHEGMVPPHLAGAYRADVDAYNGRVAERNRNAERVQAIHELHRAAVARYNLLADSVRTVAERMGDPYYPVPLPAEAALERGVAVGQRGG